MVNKSTICLLGASFDTGNLGVSALAWSSVRVIKTHWPQSQIVMVGVGRQPGKVQVQINEHSETIHTWPVRFCPNLFAAHHLIRLYIAMFLCRYAAFLRRRWASNDSALGALLRADVICDITGGDSFSDIYGLWRLFRSFLVKRLCQMTGRPFVLLPQTYGPFKGRLSRLLAGSILSRATAIYSRDQEGLEQVNQLLANRKKKAVPQLCPDVAFVLEPRKPAFDNVIPNENEESIPSDSKLIGINISGLLYNGGYTQNNQFGLACDYKRLVKDMITYFTRQPNYCVLLIPHVIPDNMPVENDLHACKAVWQSLPKELQEKVFIVDGQYDQNEIKYIIGQCDFFMGSRMHATIAALSQCIPAVGMAYSKKFAGVFQTVGVANYVVDMRSMNESETLTRIEELYQKKEDAQKILLQSIPAAKQKVLSIFQNLF